MKKQILFAFVAASAALATAQSLMFDTSVFDHSAGASLTTFNAAAPSINADDVELASAGVITSLEIEFGYAGFAFLNTNNATADATFALWSDNAGNPAPTALWSSGVTNLSFAPGSFDPASLYHIVNVAVPNIAVDSKFYWSVTVANLVEPAGSGSFGLARNTELADPGNPVGDYVAGTDTIYESIWGDNDLNDGFNWSEDDNPARDRVDPLSIRVFGVAVPEPSMAGLFFIGLACLGLIRKLKKM